MRGEVYRFVAVDFIYDENVAGNLYWYLCPEEQIFVGDEVEGPHRPPQQAAEGNCAQNYVCRALLCPLSAG